MYRAQRLEKSDRKGSLEEILANRDLLYQFHAELGGGFKHFFYFSPFLGKIPIFTNMFQRGWFNHQPEECLFGLRDSVERRDHATSPGCCWVM